MKNLKATIFISDIHREHLTGQQKIGMTLARNLSERGVKVLVVSNSPNVKSPETGALENDLELLVIPGEADFSSYLINVSTILRSVKEFNPDIIHGHGTSMALLVALLGRTLKKPTVQTIYDTGVGVPRLVKSLGLLSINHIICSSDFTKEYLRNNLQVPEGKITVLPYGIEKTWVDLGRRPLPKSKTIRITFWGDAKTDRGIDTLLEAVPKLFKRVQGATLTFAVRYYDPIYMERIRQLARTYPIEVLDTSSFKHVSEAIALADVVILPYKTTPIQPPLTLVESLSAGKPVITTDVQANRELIGENVRGVLIEPRNSNQLVRAIVDLLSDEKKRREMSTRAQSFVLNRYNWDGVMKRIFKLYDLLMED